MYIKLRILIKPSVYIEKEVLFLWLMIKKRVVIFLFITNTTRLSLRTATNYEQSLLGIYADPIIRYDHLYYKNFHIDYEQLHSDSEGAIC